MLCTIRSGKNVWNILKFQRSVALITDMGGVPVEWKGRGDVLHGECHVPSLFMRPYSCPKMWEPLPLTRVSSARAA